MWKWPRLQIVFPPQVYSPLIWCHLPRSFWDAAAAHTKLFKRLHSLAKGWAGLSVSTLQSGHPNTGSAMGLGDSPELGHSGLTWRVNWSHLIVTWKWCLWEQSCFALLCCQTNLGSKPLLKVIKRTQSKTMDRKPIFFWLEVFLLMELLHLLWHKWAEKVWLPDAILSYWSILFMSSWSYDLWNRNILTNFRASLWWYETMQSTKALESSEPGMLPTH